MVAVWARVNTVLLALVLLALLAIIGMLATGVRGGELDPENPPGSTMKALDEVEARTPISQADLPLTISQSGSYYLTENVGGVFSPGISIQANNVTLDLNGFTMAQTSPAGAAISIPSGQDNIVIHNGIISGWSTGVFTPMDASTGIRIHDMVFANNGTAVMLAQGGVLEDCTIAHSTTMGVSIGGGGNAGLVQRCHFLFNAVAMKLFGNDATIRDNDFRASGGLSVEFNTGVTGNVFLSNRFNCEDAPAPPATNVLIFNSAVDQTNYCT